MKFKQVFIAEGQDILRRMERGLARLQKSPNDAAAVQDVFLAVHTLRGNAAILGLKDIAGLAGEFEDKLDAVAKGTALIIPETLAVFLACADKLGLLLREVQDREP